MTNADKLRELKKLKQTLTDEQGFWGGEQLKNLIEELEEQLQVQPTLTEDERVILRNINSANYQFIGRNEAYYNLYLAYWEKGEKKIDTARTFDYAFNHLFQFIKNGEEYEISELLKE